MKKCSRCRQIKLIDEYNRDNSKQDGRRAMCKDCWNKLRVDHNKNYMNAIAERPCPRCGQLFTAPRSKEFCVNCYKPSYVQLNALLRRFKSMCRVDFNYCKECSVKFMLMNKNEIYCSARCRDKSKRRTYHATAKGKAQLSINSLVRRNRKRTQSTGISYSKWVRQLKTKRTFICYWCGQKTAIKDLQIDHVVPLSKGGCDGIGNVCASCSNCNLHKSNKELGQWTRQLIQPMLTL